MNQWLRTTLAPAATAAFTLFLAAGCAEAPAAEGRSADDTDPARAIIDAVAATDPDLAAQLEEIHAATRRYMDVEVALGEGYIRDPLNMCVTPEMEGVPRQLGGMGIHFFRPDLLGITGTEPRVSGVGTHTDFRQPGVLVYEPQPDGSLALVAVENLVFRDAWLDAGHDGAPEFMGNQYYTMVDNPGTDPDEAHGFSPHFELHIWLYRDNPTGLFAQFNPNATCQYHVEGENMPH